MGIVTLVVLGSLSTAATAGIMPCCLPDGSCVEFGGTGDCAAAGGRPPDGGDCSTGFCEDAGACCVGTTCTPMFLDDCEAADGYFIGDGAACETDTCHADLSITKFAQDTEPEEDSIVVFMINVTNDGPNAATGVLVTDLLPDGVTFVQINGGLGIGTYDPVSGLWDVLVSSEGAQSISPGQTYTLELQVYVHAGTAGTTITNTATIIASDQPDPDSSNDSMSANIDPVAVAPSSETGACCLPDPACIDDVTDIDCHAQGGMFLGPDTGCSAETCVLDQGACCLPDGSCRVLTPENCSNAGGTHQSGDSCPSVGPCPVPMGACCVPSTPCFEMSRDYCMIQNGAYIGDYQLCDTATCDQLEFRAPCCFMDGTCIVLTPDDCSGAGGSARDLGASCSAPVQWSVYSSSGASGACCFGSGSCDQTDLEDCNSAGGQYKGDGSSCDDVTCRGFGACCLPDGTCRDQRELGLCGKGGGVYRGDGTVCAIDGCASDVRATSTEKGSLVVVSAIELRWSGGPSPAPPGAILQDAFISLTNDYPEDVRVQMYFINGDPPLDADPATGERAHPGWNKVDNQITLTGDQPTYWSVLTGLPAVGGLAPFTALDPGFPPGRPANDGTTDRVLGGYMVAWAVDAANEEIRWNHLKAEATIVNYLEGSAWEHGSVNYAVVDPNVAHGQPTGSPGVLNLNGVEYAQSFDQLLLNFQAPGSSAFSGPRLVISDTSLSMHPVPADLRQESDGPVTVKAHFDVWNENEVKFSGTHQCVTCWDGTLLSRYGTPNNFLLAHLQTAHGKARFDGLASQNCDVDVDPNDGACGNHPDDVCSEAAALLAVHARLLSFDGGGDYDCAGGNVVGMGLDDTAVIQYDVLAPPPEAEHLGTPSKLMNWVERRMLRGKGTVRINR
ncbi:MAG: DUF11 domain-containing protein [Planctomycetes bacterium]|nr:DUF11 domain-containing protein [Planctomycetota bacterium]